jgi:hypothetical protein
MRRPTKAEQALERHAIAAHARGERWATFWQAHGEQVRQCEPYNRQRYHRLVRRLLALLTSGDTDGQQPVAVGLLWGEQWDEDDAQGVP